MSEEPVGPEWLDEAAAERLLARFRYGADADAVSNLAESQNTPHNQNTQNTADMTAAAASWRPTGPSEGRSAEVPDTLERVLAAAAAPAQPHELRGYDAARRAFEAAGAVGPSAAGTGVVGRHGSHPRGRHVASGPLARFAGVKIAALAGALTVAGVAVAAEADVLPSPLQRAAHRMLGGVGVPDPEPAGQDPSTSASSGAGGGPAGHTAHSALPTVPTHASTAGGPGLPSGTAGSPLPGGHSGTTPADEAVALCRAYVGGSNGNGNGGNGLSPGQRRRLADLAGGDQHIDAFCAQVLASATAPASASAPVVPPATPTGSAAVSTGPGNPGRTHPTHDPKTAPTTDPNGNASASLAGKKP